MLIPIENLPIRKPIKGVIHIGAHECEERVPYIKNFSINDSHIIWIDAIPSKVNEMREKLPFSTILNECLSNVDDKEVSFMLTNNYQSSSMLNFKTHAVEHPHVFEIGRLTLKTKTLNTIFKNNSFNPRSYNFMNLDIQGAELLALQGSSDILPHIDYIYAEVNEKELYEGCALIGDIDNFLTGYGFKRILTSMTPHGWGDAFYTKF